MASSICAMRSWGTMPARSPMRLTSTDLICSTLQLPGRVVTLMATHSSQKPYSLPTGHVRTAIV